MTAASLSYLPLAAGGAVANTLGRGGLWTLGQFMRAPFAISAVVAMTGFSIIACSNALYHQPGKHPAPLFFSAPAKVSAPIAKPVIPATRGKAPQVSNLIDNSTTGSVGDAAGPVKIGNSDVLSVQRKLQTFGFFQGTVDGYYGPKTASAIRAFQLRAGIKPQGALTKDMVATILRTNALDLQPAPAPLPATGGQQTQLAAAPVPLPPLPQASSPAATATPPVAMASVAPLPAQRRAPAPESARNDVLDTAAQTAAGAFDAITNMVGNLANGHDDSAPIPEMRPAAAVPPATDDTPGTSVVAMNNAPKPSPIALQAQPVALQAQPDAPQTPAATQNQASDGQSPAPDATQLAQTDAQPAQTDQAPLTPAEKLAAQIGTAPPSQVAMISPDDAASQAPPDGAADPALITKIQRGLASLGFLGNKIDGVPGEATAKAIRNFEVFYNYSVTGAATPQLLNLLIAQGAVI